MDSVGKIVDASSRQYMVIDEVDGWQFITQHIECIDSDNQNLQREYILPSKYIVSEHLGDKVEESLEITNDILVPGNFGVKACLGSHFNT